MSKSRRAAKSAASLFLIQRLGSVVDQADQLLLVDVVGGAAQRRGKPAVMLHAHADVRLGLGAHAHFACRLDAENAGQPVLSSICAQVLLARIIISLTSVSMGEPRSRRTTETLPSSSNSML